jgi:hypothetical protein
MTYDQLYDYVVKYVASPHTAIVEHDKRRALLIITAFQDFILDCQNENVDVNTIDFADYVHQQLDILEGKK